MTLAMTKKKGKQGKLTGEPEGVGGEVGRSRKEGEADESQRGGGISGSRQLEQEKVGRSGDEGEGKSQEPRAGNEGANKQVPEGM